MNMKEALERKIDLLQGARSKLCRAHHLIEQMAAASENRTAKLKSQLEFLAVASPNPVNPVNPV